MPNIFAKRLVSVGLQKLLLCFFICVALIPVVFLGAWVQGHALNSEYQAVEEKHLLLAKNISGALSRYATDLKSIFIATSESKPEPFPNDIQTLLKSVNIQVFVLVEEDQPAFCMGNKNFLPEGGLERLRAETNRAWGQPGSVIMSPVVINQQGKPTIYLLRVTRRGVLAIAGVNTDYVKQVQRTIAFGENGHAAIVDQTGQAIAHPLAEWEDTAKDISQLKPVAQMLARKTGVIEFYSPAVKADMIAGYAFVPETGWGVMIPQPYSEIQALARNTKIVALWVAILGLLLAFFVSWRLTNYILNPIKSVINASEALSTRNNIKALPTRHKFFPKEIETLLLTFNQMATEVSIARATLEQRVEARTQALVKEVERRKQLEKQLVQQATHDALTGLPNRRLLTERLQSLLAVAKRSHQTIALLFLDLDGFKSVNDTYGHQLGDALLTQVAERLRINLRESDSIFRLGGDEFVVLLEQVSSPSAAQVLSYKLLSALKQPFVIQGHKIMVGCSIGIKTSHGDQQETAIKILSDADKAMYSAKAKGNCAIIYT